jgi:hypothetical protein
MEFVQLDVKTLFQVIRLQHVEGNQFGKYSVDGITRLSSVGFGVLVSDRAWHVLDPDALRYQHEAQTDTEFQIAMRRSISLLFRDCT